MHWSGREKDCWIFFGLCADVLMLVDTVSFPEECAVEAISPSYVVAGLGHRRRAGASPVLRAATGLGAGSATANALLAVGGAAWMGIWKRGGGVY